MPRIKATPTGNRPPKPPKPPKRIPRISLPPSPMAMQFRHLKPDWRAYIECVDLAARNGDKQMAKFYGAFLALPLREQLTIQPEQLCDLSGVKPSELYGAVCAQLWDSANRESSILTAMAMPKIVSRTITEAGKVKGIKDREMFHKHTGFLPQPKGISINQQVAVAPSISPSLPSMAQTILDMPTDNELLGLPSAMDEGAETHIVDAEEINDEDGEEEDE